jgi:hypothetical protein
VDLLVPELQKRGLMWEDYSAPGSSLRENLTGVKGQIGVSKDYYAYQFKYPSDFGEDSMAKVERNRNGVTKSKA